MKKIILTLLLFLCINGVSQASTPIDFIYINGSKNNDVKAYNWFIKGISGLHPVLKEEIEKDALMSKHFLKDGAYTIEEKPSNYFWGYKSKQDLFSMQKSAKLLQSVSPWVAYCVRNTIADIMHDAIWVSKEHNMMSVIQELNEQVKADAKAGKKVVLLGYSAGTFITFEYLLAKLQYVNIASWFSDKGISPELAKIMNKTPNKNTCIAAMAASKMTSVSVLGNVEVNKNQAELKKAYMNIDKYTGEYCVPDKQVIGVVNYASPIPLFYSDISDNSRDSSQFLSLLYKYLIENEFFFLTVNFSDDPLGFPNDVNYTNKEIENVVGIKLKEQKGFLYDYSNTISMRTVLAAHTSYWKAKKKFAKAIVKGYNEGYNLQYGEADCKK